MGVLSKLDMWRQITSLNIWQGRPRFSGNKLLNQPK